MEDKGSDDRYFFVTHWRVPGTSEQVFRLFQQVERLPQWWPAVYLQVSERERGNASGIGRSYDLLTKGWLPYTLKWTLTVSEVEFPTRISLSASGDLSGQGTWHLAQDGDCVDLTYDWEVSADKPLLRRLAPLFKPAFALNHAWAMRQGETSLRLELQRLQATSMDEALKVPPPPAPEPAYRPWALLGGAAALLAALGWVSGRKKPGKGKED